MIFIRGLGILCLNIFVTSLYVVKKGGYAKKNCWGILIYYIYLCLIRFYFWIFQFLVYFIHGHHEHQQYVIIGQYSHTWRM